MAIILLNVANVEVLPVPVSAWLIYSFRLHRTRPRLTAPFGPFNADSAKGRKIEIHLRVYQSFPILFCPFFSLLPHIITYLLATSQPN